MRNFRILTSLNVVPTKNLADYWYRITRGTSTNIMFNLDDKAYPFERITQLVYRFTNKNGQIISFDLYKYLYNQDGTIEAIFNDKYFDHISGYSIDAEGHEVPYEYINLKLSGDDTNKFWLADKSKPIIFEVVVTLNNDPDRDTSANYNYIEKQLPVIVLPNPEV